MATTEFTLDDDVYTDAFFEELMELESKITQQPPPQPPLRLPPQSVTSAPSYVFTSLKTVPTELPKSSVADNNSHSPPRLLSQPNPSFTHLSTDTRSVSSPSSEEQSEIERLKVSFSSFFFFFFSKFFYSLVIDFVDFASERVKDSIQEGFGFGMPINTLYT